MSVKKFRFVSPGIFINEIDQSQLESLPARMGPVIIGRSERGPGFRPTTVSSFAEFVETFGNPIPGGEVDDVWRKGNYNGPTYAAYAAQAYLKHSNPVTFIRLLGSHHDAHDGWSNDSIGLHGIAGYRTKNLVGSQGGAYGLFVMPSASLGTGSTATITVAGTLDDNMTVTIIDSKGLSKAYIATDSNDLNVDPPKFGRGGSTANIVDALQAAIECANGHNGSIICQQDSAGAILTLSQKARGSDGDTTITLSTSTNITKTNFTGGTKDSQIESSGSLAAVWYINEGYMFLSGALRGTETGSAPAPVIVSGSSVLIGNTDNLTWKAVIKDTSHNTVVETAFSFDPDSDSHIRKAFNTNPQLVNTNIYSQGTTSYWLGQTFERSVQDLLVNNTTSNSCWGLLVQLASGSTEYAKQTKEHMPSETGWIVSQDTSADPAGFDLLDQQRTKRLFKFVSLDAGSEWNQNNLKISIEDIRPAKNEKTWSTFTVTIRSIDDTDKNQKILEKYTNCNLNASSPNYIARKIGDKQTSYDKAKKLLKVGGNYENQSRYVRVKTNEGVYSKDLLPFGCYGPPRYRKFTFTSGSSGAPQTNPASTSPATDLQYTFITAGSSMDSEATGSRSSANEALPVHLSGPDVASGEIWTGYDNTVGVKLTASMEFAALALRDLGTDGGFIDQSKAYWGVDVSRKGANDVRYDTGVVDYLKTLPDQTTADTIDFHLTSKNAECQFLFTLDDLREDTDTVVQYVSGSRKDSPNNSAETLKSITAKSGSNFLLTASSMGHDKFTTVLYGGFDGFDIKEKEPFNNTRALSVSTEKGSYAYFSATKAIEIIKDAERVECNLLAMPGIINQNLTARLVREAETRADTLAIIDIENDFTPTGENNNTDMENQGDVDIAVRAMKDRAIDSSYGAAYYPWVQIKDTRNNRILWAPPSVVALGAMAYSDEVRDVWFAPAGFSRGGLTATGAGGVPVVGVNQQLTSKQRDKLYEVHINPIASFPAEGIVIFGQKTLQLTPSALDRINVRRLLIFLKKEISRIASTTLFEPNLEVTWSSFTAQADALLGSVKARLGLADYKLVLNESTTTPELIDRNIMYAKVFLKPARAIEFIALDFIITRSGASFED